MKWRSTTALALLSFALGLYLLIVEGTLETTEERAAAKGRIWRGDSDGVVAVTIERAGVTIVLRKTGDVGKETWRIESPVTDLGEATEIVSLVNQVEFAKSPREVEGISDFAQYGTQTPRLTLTLEERDGETTVFRFGVAAPGGKFVYARKDDDLSVLLVEKYLFESIDKDANHWRGKRLVRAKRSRAVAYELRLAEGVFEARVVDDFWIAVTPARGRAAEGAIDKVFSAMEELEIEKFVDDAAAPEKLAGYGLGAPTATVRIEVREGAAPIGVLFGRSEGESIYAMREGVPSVFSIPKSKLVSLAAVARDVRERVFFPHVPVDVTAMKMERDGVTLSLEKEESDDGTEKWKVVAPSEDDADLGEVENTIRELRKLTVVDFLPEGEALAGYGLEPGLAVLEVKVKPGFDDFDFDALSDEDDDDSGDEEKLTVDRFILGNLTADGAHRYATRKGEGVVLTVPASAWDLFSTSRLRFMDKKILEFSKWNAKELTVVRPTGTVRAVSDAGSWTVKEPMEVPGDKDAIGAVLDLVSALQADEIVELEPGNLAPYGLAAPEHKVIVVAKGWEDDAEEESYEVHFGADAGGGKVFGYLPERKIVFKLDVLKLAAVDADLIGKKVTGFTPWEVKSLLFEREAGPLELINVDGDWRITRPTPGEADKMLMEMWLKTYVENLAAKRVAPEQPTDAATYGFDAPRLEWTVATATGAKVFVFGGNDAADGLVPVRAEGTGLIYFVSKEVFSNLVAGPTESAERGPPPDVPPMPLPDAPVTP